MSAWTAERLDALPEGTVIEVAWESASPDRLINPEPGYWGSLDARDESECDWASDELAGNKWVLSIRVVSVPIEALLAVDMTEDSTGLLMLESEQDEFRASLSAAIAHVIGGEL